MPSCDPFVAERAVFHEDSVFPRVVYDDVSTLLGSSIPTMSLVSQCTVGVPVTVVPQNFAIPGSSVNFSSLLQRADVHPARSRTTLAHRTARAPSRVSFPIATSSRSVHSSDLRPTPTRAPELQWLFRPRRFARPRRLAPIRDLQVCFTPLPRLGFRLQGFFPA